MPSHPTAKHIFDIIVIRFPTLDFYSMFLKFPTHSSNSIRIYTFNDFSSICERVLDLQKFVFARNLYNSCFLAIDMDSQFSCNFADILEQIFQYLFTRIHDVPIIHVPSIKLLLTHILDIIVNRIRIVNPNNL